MKPHQAAPHHSPFSANPLAFLEARIQHSDELFWLSENELCVSEPEMAKSVLANTSGNFAEHSDFFRHRHGFIKPRSLQQQIARQAVAVLNRHIKTNQHHLPSIVHTALHPKAVFPDAANLLMLKLLGPALIRPGTASGCEHLLQHIVQRSILRGKRHQPPPATGFWFRLRTVYQLGLELQRRGRRSRAQGVDTAHDLLDVIGGHGAGQCSPDQMAQVFLSFIVAIVGSLGFLLAWALYLQGRHGSGGASARHTVQETLRLWPIAWVLARQVQRECRFGPYQLEPGQQAIVCPYVTQRQQRHWSQAHRFMPERWLQPPPAAYCPFGWGEHRCTAAGLSLSLVSDLLQTINHHYRLDYRFAGVRPCVGVALSPPYFEVALTAHDPAT